MGDSIAPPPPPPRSPSPVRRANTAGERGLVPVHGFSYAAPGGDYRGLQIVHILGCSNGGSDSSEFDDEVRHIVSGLDLRTFDAVEKVCFGILAARGCDSLAVASAGCHVDRTTSLGFFARFHTPEGSSQSFAPSSSLLVSSGFHSTMASDPMVPSASWPSIDEDRSQDPLYVPSVVEVDDSQRRLPSPVERLHPVSGSFTATSDWTDRRTKTMHLLQVAFALRIGSLRCRPLPPSFPRGRALVPVVVLPRIPPFPPAAVLLFLCPKDTMSLLLKPRNDGATPLPGRIALPPLC